jgi:hypothetical protein
MTRIALDFVTVAPKASPTVDVSSWAHTDGAPDAESALALALDAPVLVVDEDEHATPNVHAAATAIAVTRRIPPIAPHHVTPRSDAFATLGRWRAK